MNKETAKEYALALFDLALERQDIEDIKADLITLNMLIKENELFTKLLTHPKLSKETKNEIFSSVFKGINQTLHNFFFVLIENDHADGVEFITDAYMKLYNEYNEILTVRAVTTIPITENQIIGLSNELQIKYRRKVKINNEIDDSILGGIRIHIGNEIIDYTIKNQIQNLKLNILRNT